MGYRIAIIGATGLVGRTFLKVLEERKFPVDDILPLASQGNREIKFRGKLYEVKPLHSFKEFNKIDFAFFSAGAAVSKKYAPLFVKKNIRVIDNSPAFRMEENIPLIVPEINKGILKQEDLLIANPNCSTIQLVMSIAGLKDLIEEVYVVTFQSVSGAGREGLEQLLGEEKGKEIHYKKFYPRIHRNIVPQIGELGASLYCSEEWKIMNETRKILSRWDLKITATTVRVPVEVGHSLSVTFKLKEDLTYDEVRNRILSIENTVFVDGYITPIEVAGKDEVYISRLRRNPLMDNVWDMWVVADNLRKGAATNAIQIAEYLYKN
ncbi:aspartate-semialdehyde dehydrogenase [Candidatus Pacearchaeota archaeon]|nr:MAG: aspartate-semialdehyde dehydrogenase [Candidatus Pacearchaeota archaeon]